MSESTPVELELLLSEFGPPGVDGVLEEVVTVVVVVPDVVVFAVKDLIE